MKKLLMRCQACQLYTLKESCPKCGEMTKSPHPPRYSPENRYGKYRRMLKYPEAYGVSNSGGGNDVGDQPERGGENDG